MRRSLFIGLACLTACRGTTPDRGPAADAQRSPDTTRESARGSLTPWPDVIGDFTAMANTATGEALLLRRDTTTTPDHISVIGYDSVPTPVKLQDVRPLPCAARALLRVSGAPSGWSLALDSARARPVLIDALEDLSRADSQRVVVRVQRALSSLPDSADAMEFGGLPVVVRDAWIVHFPSRPVVVARAARLRNLEAAAHEELRFVVLEHDVPRFVARVAGEEDAVESWDLLAALLTDRGPLLAIAREGARTLQLELVIYEQNDWHSLWRSDALACVAPH